MAQIKINDLSIAGSDLFSDSESYLTELSNDSEMLNVKGGTIIGTRTIARNFTAIAQVVQVVQVAKIV